MDKELGFTDVNEVYHVLMPAMEKWDRIGVLLGVDIEKLMSISQRCQRVDQCLFSMLVAWLQEKEGKKTYKKIVKALRSKKVKKDVLAAEIIKEKDSKHYTKADIMHSIQNTTRPAETEVVSSLETTTSPSETEIKSLVVTPAKKHPLPEPLLEKYLRAYYSKGSESQKDDWPPSFHIDYVNLVLVQQKKMPLAKARAKKAISLSVHGQIEHISGQRVGLNDILTSDDDRVTIVNGGPGAGKTTLAKKLRKEWAGQQLLTKFRLTLYIPLREPIVRLSENVNDLLNYFGERCNEADRELIKSEEGAGVLFILDGWDELRLSCRGEQQFFPRLISGNIMPGSKVMVLSRPGASIDILRHADQVIEVLGFTRDQVKKYIQMYFADEDEGASKLISDLERYPNVASTCYVPINLAIVCHVYHALDFNLPLTITEVYQWFIIHTVMRYLKKKETIEEIKVDLPAIDEPKDFFVLTEFNDCVKKSFNDSIIETLQLLGELAIDGLQNDDLCFSRKQLVSTCKLDEQDVQFDGFGLLKPVQISFCARMEPYYHFLHLSIQEFIAAFYISRLDEVLQGESLLKIDSERFSTVFKHFCGIDQFQSAPLRKLFERNSHVELYHLEGIHEGQWHDYCKQVAKKCQNTFRFEGKNLQAHEWEVLSYIMLRSTTWWTFECSRSLVDANGMACFGRHLSENSQVLHRLCFDKIHIDHQAYVHVAKTCQGQTGLKEIEFRHCNIPDDGIFTIFGALESHPSLQLVRVYDDSPSAVVVNAFLKLLPTLPRLQRIELNIRSFSDGNYLDIIQCAKKCNPPPHVAMPNDPAQFTSSYLGLGEIGVSRINPIEKDTDGPSVTLEELVEHMELDKNLLNRRCKDAHFMEIASVLTKCDNIIDIPILRMSKTSFNPNQKDEAILGCLQAWKKRCGFKATYKCLVEELLSSGNAEIAEDICNIVSRLSSTISDSREVSIAAAEKVSVQERADPTVEVLQESKKKVHIPPKRSLDSKPKLHELDRLEVGIAVVSVIKMAASKWEDVATRLYFEGFSISSIKRDNSQSVEGACRAVFIDWLGGMEQLREPKTWRTVIKVLKEADMSELAIRLEDVLTQQ